jgi:hypothetical protein
MTSDLNQKILTSIQLTLNNQVAQSDGKLLPATPSVDIPSIAKQTYVDVLKLLDVCDSFNTYLFFNKTTIENIRAAILASQEFNLNFITNLYSMLLLNGVTEQDIISLVASQTALADSKLIDVNIETYAPDEKYINHTANSSKNVIYYGVIFILTLYVKQAKNLVNEVFTERLIHGNDDK